MFFQLDYMLQRKRKYTDHRYAISRVLLRIFGVLNKWWKEYFSISSSLFSFSSSGSRKFEDKSILLNLAILRMIRPAFFVFFLFTSQRIDSGTKLKKNTGKLVHFYTKGDIKLRLASSLRRIFSQEISVTILRAYFKTISRTESH